jgi:hypothetical protein
MGVEIDTTAFRGQVRAFLPELRRGIYEALLAAGENVRAAITSGSYYKDRTGKTSKSFRVVPRSSTEAQVTAPGKVPIILDEGSKAHVIVAKKAGALRFVVAGSVLFRRKVNHPGTKPTAFVAKESARLGDTLLPQLGQAATDQAITGAGLG